MSQPHIFTAVVRNARETMWIGDPPEYGKEVRLVNAEEYENLLAKYNERGVAMRETGDVVRSLYVGSEVSKRITRMKQQIDDLEREIARLRGVSEATV